MRLLVLGHLDVVGDGGRSLLVPGAKERLVLGLLVAAAPGTMSVDRLIEVLWDGEPPPTAHKSLQGHVVRLRTALEPERPAGSTGRYVARRGPGYALAIERDGIDALVFGDLVARGRARLLSGDAAAAATELTDALALWRDEPYADWPDAAFAEAERRRLGEVHSAAVSGLLEARLALGEHAVVVPELERLITEQPLREGWWRLLMIALYRDGRQADAMAAGRRVRALLAAELGAEPGPELRQVETAVLTQDPVLDLPQQRPPPDVRPGPPPAGWSSDACPYLGLAAYQVEDAARFRGRQRLVLTLVRALRSAQVLVVSGPSGAGKSSVVRAGVVPALREGALSGSAGWTPLVLTPAGRAVDALTALTGESPPPDPVLLVCDQFEELWAPGTEAAERDAFLDALLSLLDDGVVARCVLVVRGDLVGRLAEHAALAARIEGSVVLVPPLTDPELRDVVVEPARLAGLTVESELLDVVVADVVGQPSALPLLSTALVATWQARRGSVLTLAGFLEAGGVAGALARSAEAAYAALDDEARRRARQVLVRLGDVGGSGLPVRRPVPLHELDLDGPGGDVRRLVVEEFVGRRLLSVDAERLQVAHEALLTEWPRLARWLDEDAAGRAVRRALAPAAVEWHANGRPAEELFRGARLSAALDWATRAEGDLTQWEREFVDASRRQSDAELDQARARAEHEANGRVRTRRLATGLAAVLVLALLATGQAVRYQRDADATAQDALANRLAALSTTVPGLDVALLLAAQGVRLAATPETEGGLLAALLQHRRAVRAVPIDGLPLGADLGADGRSLFIGTGPSMTTWQVDAAALPRTFPLRLPGGWLGTDVSPVAPVVAISGEDDDGPWVQLLTAADVDVSSFAGEVLGGTPMDVSFTADGQALRLLVVAPGGPEGWHWRVRQLDLGTGAVRDLGLTGTLRGADERPGATFADDGSGVVVWNSVAATRIDLQDRRQVPVAVVRRSAGTAEVLALGHGAAVQRWADGAFALFGRDGRLVQQVVDTSEPVADVALAPDGTWAVTAGSSGAAVVWDVDAASGRWSPRETLTGHSGEVVSVEVAATGRLLLTVSTDGTVIAWDMTADSGFGGTYPGLAGRWMANRPQLVRPGLLVAPTRGLSGSAGRTRVPQSDTLDVAATFVEPGTGKVLAEVPLGDTLPGTLFGSSVAVSPDTTRVAVTSGLATTVLDTATREVLGRIVLPARGGRGELGEELPAEVVWCAAWTPDGSRLLLGTEATHGGVDGAVVVVDPATWTPERRVDVGMAPQSMELSPDGTSLVVASASSPEIAVLEARTLGVQRRVALPDDDRVYDLSFSADGRLLAAGGERGVVHVFDTRHWRPAHEPVQAHSDAVLQVEWRSDGRTVLSSGRDGAVALVDTDRGLVRGAPLPASSEPGPGYSFLLPGSADELVVLSGERAGRRYPLDPARWLAAACTIVSRDLTRAEWDRYLPGQAYRPTCSDLS